MRQSHAEQCEYRSSDDFHGTPGAGGTVPTHPWWDDDEETDEAVLAVHYTDTADWVHASRRSSNDHCQCHVLAITF